jgi:general stress protein YciG
MPQKPMARRTPEERRFFGRKGGLATAARVSPSQWTREQARAAGKKGGQARGRSRKVGRRP